MIIIFKSITFNCYTVHNAQVCTLRCEDIGDKLNVEDTCLLMLKKSDEINFIFYFVNKKSATSVQYFRLKIVQVALK